MAERQLPGLGLTGFWTPGGDGWDVGMDANLRMLSAVTQMGVLSKTTDLPATPTDGQIFIVPSGTDANKIAIRDNGAWVHVTPKAGWRAWIADTSKYAHFDGSSWVDEVDNEGVPEAPSDGKTYGRKDGEWAEVTGGNADAFELSAYLSGIPGPSELLFVYAATASFKLPVNLTGSRATSERSATASATFEVRKNGFPAGSITFPAGSSTGTFALEVEVAFAAGDKLTLLAPSTADATLADISISILGSRV